MFPLAKDWLTLSSSKVLNQALSDWPAITTKRLSALAKQHSSYSSAQQPTTSSNCAAQGRMTSTKLLFIVALGLAVFAIAAMADDDYDYKYDDNKGPCKGGYWPDGKGCCPKIIHGKAYYRDGNKCYPKDVGCGVYYADGNGYTHPRTYTIKTSTGTD
jgi:hypothetical protein